MLKQQPVTKQAELEYYEGKVVKGVVNLAGALIVPEKPGRFRVVSKHKKKTRVMELATEDDKIADCMGWVRGNDFGTCFEHCGGNGPCV